MCAWSFPIHSILVTYYVSEFCSGGIHMNRNRVILVRTTSTITSVVVGSEYHPISQAKYINTLARAMHIETAPAISHPVLSVRIVRVSRGPRHSILVTYYVPGALLFMMQIYKIFSNKKKSSKYFFIPRICITLAFEK